MVTESPVSTIQTVFDVAPHGCRLTLVPWAAVLATPTHRPLPTPNGVYSSSNAGSFGKPLPFGPVVGRPRPLPECSSTAADTRPAPKKSDVKPWNDALMSSAGSVSLVRNRMIGWPTLAP